MAKTKIGNKLQQKWVNSNQAVVAMIALTALAAPAHASGDQSFSDGVDWILGLMQGSMGGIIMLIAIISAVLGMLLGGWKGLLTVVGILFGLIILPPAIMPFFSAAIPL